MGAPEEEGSPTVSKTGSIPGRLPGGGGGGWGGCGNANGKGCSSRGRVTEDQVLHRGHPSQRWGEGGAGGKESQKVRLLRQQKEKWSVQNLKCYVPFLGLIFACIRGNT